MIRPAWLPMRAGTSSRTIFSIFFCFEPLSRYIKSDFIICAISIPACIKIGKRYFHHISFVFDIFFIFSWAVSNGSITEQGAFWCFFLFLMYALNHALVGLGNWVIQNLSLRCFWKVIWFSETHSWCGISPWIKREFPDIYDYYGGGKGRRTICGCLDVWLVFVFFLVHIDTSQLHNVLGDYRSIQDISLFLEGTTWLKRWIWTYRHEKKWKSVNIFNSGSVI